MHSFYSYKTRRTEFIDQVDTDGWLVKVYGISADSQSLPDSVVADGMKFVLPYLPQPAVTEQRYGIGFLTIHHGSMRNWYLLDWWEKEDILHHKLFSSPLGNPGSISVEADTSLIACVHELRVIAFESDAWVKTVLSSDGVPNFEEYLQLRMTAVD